jgi:hypothetical protein
MQRTYGYFPMNFQSLQIWKKSNRIFLKKSPRARSAPVWAAPVQAGPIHPRRAGDGRFKRPASGASQSATPGGRIGTGRRVPFDLVKIDGLGSSSPRERTGAAETLAPLGEEEGLT